MTTVRAVLELPDSASDKEVRTAFAALEPDLQERLAGPEAREYVLAAAVKAGKFSENRVAVYRQGWQRDPIGTLAQIERLTAPGGGQAGDWFPGRRSDAVAS